MAVVALLLTALVDPAAFAQSSEKTRLTNSFEQQLQTAVLIEEHISKPYKTQADGGDPGPITLPAANASPPDIGFRCAFSTIRSYSCIASPPSRDGPTRAPPSTQRFAI